VDGDLDLVWGKEQAQQGRISHLEQVLELLCEGVKILGKGGSGYGSGGDRASYRPSHFDIRSEGDGEGAIGICEDTGGYVEEGGANNGGLVVGGWRGARSVEPSFCCGERLGGLKDRHGVADGPDLNRSEGALHLIFLLGKDLHGGLSIGLFGLGAVGLQMTRDERGGVRVLAVTKWVGFP